MRDKMEQYMDRFQMIIPGDVVVAGVSGGADSVCLLLLLEEICRERGNRLVAVHVNHGIRGAEADRDEAYVQKLCRERNIPCECYHIQAKELAKSGGCSEEEAGRNARRKAFSDTADKYGGTKIALAHHMDDNVETFFLHAARGSRLRGLGGIYPVNGRYIRPLLCVSRREILEYLKEKEIPYCIDRTNEGDEYTRNRIRNHVIPYMEEQVNAKTSEHISKAMEQLREIQAFLERQEKEAEKQCLDAEGGRVWIRKEKWMSLDPLLQPALLRRALVLCAEREKDIGNSHVEILEQLLESQVGKRVSLPYGMTARREYAGICIERNTGNLPEEKRGICPVILPVKTKEEGKVRSGNWEICWKIIRSRQGNKEIPKKTYTKWFDYGIIKHDLQIRPRNCGDMIVIDAKGHRQKLKSFFINEKIPSEKRDRIPLLADGKEILWIAGYRQSGAYRVTEKTTVILEITIRGGTEHE